MRILATLLLAFSIFLTPRLLGDDDDYSLQEPDVPVLLVEFLANKFKQSEAEIKKIVWYAYSLGKPNSFPTPADILAVISVESGFRPTAIHHIGPSVGLMQINAFVHGSERLLEPYVNMVKGVGLLSQYRDLAGSDLKALVYYNAGPFGGKRICSTKFQCFTDYTKKVGKAKAEIVSVIEKG
jgi:soluble lytic murein transglycosylase-like protein